jgi:hypothetical protein
VMHRPERPLTWAERLSSAASNQPQRRLRPVVTPFSAPTLLRCQPTVPGFSQSSSVGNGPPPTRVQ